MNELLVLAKLLDGFANEGCFEIIRAEKTGDTWTLTVRRLSEDEGNK